MDKYNVKLKEYNQQTVVSIYDKPITLKDQYDNSILYLKRFRSINSTLIFDNGDGTGIFECNEKMLTDEKIRVCKKYHLDFYSINYTVKSIYTANIISDETRKERNLISSVNRTKSKVYDLSYANEWSYFLTLTFQDDLLIDSYGDGSWNYDVCCKALHQYLVSLRRNFPSLSYLGVPEYHRYYYNTQTSQKVYYNKTELTEEIYQKIFEKPVRTQQEQLIVDNVANGIYKRRFHFHFLVNNFPDYLLSVSITKSGKIRRTKNGLIIYNVSNYKWGYTTATQIVNLMATQAYITKYISKSLVSVAKGRKRYWTSTNLQQPIVHKLNLPKTERTEIISELFNVVESTSRKKKTELKINNYENTIHKYVVLDKELAICDSSVNEYINKFDNALNLSIFKDISEVESYLNGPFCPLLYCDPMLNIRKQPFTYVYLNNQYYIAKLINDKYIVENL